MRTRFSDAPPKAEKAHVWKAKAGDRRDRAYCYWTFAPCPRAPAEQIAERGRGTGRQRGGRFARKTEMPEDLAQHVGRLDRRGAFALRRGRPGRRASR